MVKYKAQVKLGPFLCNLVAKMKCLKQSEYSVILQ